MVFAALELDVPGMVAESDVVAIVAPGEGVPEPGAAQGAEPTYYAMVLRVLKGPAGLVGDQVRWSAPAPYGRFGWPDPSRSVRGLALLKVTAEGAYELTHPTCGYIPLSPTPPDGEVVGGDLIEVIRAEMLHCLKGADWELAYMAAQRLGFFPPDAATEEALIELLPRLEPGLAATASAALVRMSSARGLEAAVELLQRPPMPDAVSSEARDRLVSAVWGLSDERCVRDVARLMKAEEADVRQGAAHALGNMASPEAVKALGEALWDTDQMVRYRAVESLCEITCTRPGAPIFTIYEEEEQKYLGFWRKWYEEVGRPGIGEPDGEQRE
jgi:hypothetical protein